MEFIPSKGLVARVGRRIAELREDASLTQQHLADRMGFSPQYLRRVEAGGVNLSIMSLERFADALDVHVVDLFEAPRSMGQRNPGRPPKHRASVLPSVRAAKPEPVTSSSHQEPSSDEVPPKALPAVLTFEPREGIDDVEGDDQ
jgi:transcriptional regulator with XRE-family HTH domain